LSSTWMVAVGEVVVVGGGMVTVSVALTVVADIIVKKDFTFTIRIKSVTKLNILFFEFY